jgi:hypothetical protein
MLTIQIEDHQLERRLIQKARASGKSVQELARELIAGQLAEPDALDFEIPRMDVRQHTRVIDTPLTEEEEALLAENKEIKLFSQVKDSARYVHQLRRKSAQ